MICNAHVPSKASTRCGKSAVSEVSGDVQGAHPLEGTSALRRDCHCGEIVIAEVSSDG